MTEQYGPEVMMAEQVRLAEQDHLLLKVVGGYPKRLLLYTNSSGRTAATADSMYAAATAEQNRLLRRNFFRMREAHGALESLPEDERGECPRQLPPPHSLPMGPGWDYYGPPEDMSDETANLEVRYGFLHKLFSEEKGRQALGRDAYKGLDAQAPPMQCVNIDGACATTARDESIWDSGSQKECYYVLVPDDMHECVRAASEHIAMITDGAFHRIGIELYHSQARGDGHVRFVGGDERMATYVRHMGAALPTPPHFAPGWCDCVTAV